jgi:23S rRNA (cytosine1962-C5)-methyltransferase
VQVVHACRYAPPTRPVLAADRDDDGVTADDGYHLLDAGDGRRLERFGSRVVDRPAPSVADVARRADGDAWRAADLRFDRDRGWTGPATEPWLLAVDGVTLDLRPTAAGQVGLFPEHVQAWPWLRERVAMRVAARAAPEVLRSPPENLEPGPEILSLFAYTGATTLALAAAGARVAHVDASRPAVAWARRNAELSDSTERPIRWIVDDALTYTRREGRRGRRYAGVVLDPPTFGHGPAGSRWALVDALDELLEACAAVAEPDAFVLLTAHATDVRPEDLAGALERAFGVPAELEAATLDLDARSGAVLPLGVAARMIRR